MIGDVILVGTFNHKIDYKKRIMIPSKFRPEGKQNLYAKPTEDHIEIYNENEFKKLCASYDNEIEKFMFLADARLLDVDSQKRITLVNNEIIRYGIRNEIIIIGEENHFSIYEKETYNDKLTNIKKLIKEKKDQ